MNNFLELKKGLMLLDPFIRLKRLKEILLHVKSEQYRKELIEIARITINQLNQLREGEVRSTLDNKLSQDNEKETSVENIKRTIEEIAEEENTLTKREEGQNISPESPNKKNIDGFYGKNESEDLTNFYKSEELNSFYEPLEEDKKDKRFYF